MNERRRTLLFSKSNIPSENGVYIESVDHEFYLTNDWDSANTANSIAVVADECKFRIALQGASSMMQMDNDTYNPWNRYLSGTTNSGTTDETKAITDYSGAANTQLIVEKCQSSTEYAAGACNAYTFPDGETKGYLPAEGELYLAYQNKAAINAALTKCGGSVLVSNFHWSSTFYGLAKGDNRRCWGLDCGDGGISYERLAVNAYVRPFAPLEDSN